MAIVRPKDVIAEIDKVYTQPDGPGMLLLDQATIKHVRRVLKLIQQIPAELGPKSPYERKFYEAVTIIRSKLQEAAADFSTVCFLYGSPQHNGENPLSILRRTLFWCPDLRPEEVRRRILELAAENERSGSPIDYRDVMAIGSIRICAWMKFADICESLRTKGVPR